LSLLLGATRPAIASKISLKGIKIKPLQTNSLRWSVGVLIGLRVSNKHYTNFEVVFSKVYAWEWDGIYF